MKDCSSDGDILKMLDFLINNTFVEFGGQFFYQALGIPLNKNLTPLLADFLLFSYEAAFFQWIKENKMVIYSNILSLYIPSEL